MWEKGSSSDKVVHVANSVKPVPILISGATSVLSHGLVTVHFVTANLGIQVSRDNGEVIQCILVSILSVICWGVTLGQCDVVVSSS